MNVKLLTRVREALRTQENRITFKGYRGLSRADLQMVLFLVDSREEPNHLGAEAQKLYDDIVSINELEQANGNSKHQPPEY